VVVLLVLTTSGCGMNRRYANNQIRQLPFSAGTIAYTSVDPGIVTASGEQPSEATDALAAKTQKLVITYPHPSPRLGRKYAEVVLQVEPARAEPAPDRTVRDLLPASLRRADAANETAATAAPTEYRAAITYDEFTFLTHDLVADGFFERGERAGGVDVSVTLGPRTTSKTWDRVPSLEKLIARVQSDHRQNLATRPAAPVAQPASAELSAPTTEESPDEAATQPASVELSTPTTEGSPDEAAAQPANSLHDPAQF
jgi:hypothetical protein